MPRRACAGESRRKEQRDGIARYERPMRLGRDMFAHASRANIPPPQPHDVTEIDAGHETPDATRLLGFFHANFLSVK